MQLELVQQATAALKSLSTEAEPGSFELIFMSVAVTAG